MTISLLNGQVVTPVDIATLAGLLWAHNNHFFRVAWISNQNKRLRKTGPGLAYKYRDVQKLYVTTVRNNYNFEASVQSLLQNRGQAEHGENWQAEERTWGNHIPHTPFVVHQCDDPGEPYRLYGHFLPIRWHHLLGETGYYVDGEKADDTIIRSLEYARRVPTAPLDVARRDKHPVNPRLDNVIAFKIGGSWYSVTPPTFEDIEALAHAADEFAAAIAVAV